MTALIGYTNKLLSAAAVITTSGDDPAYPKENAASWKTSTWWKADAAGDVYLYVDMGSAIAIDCWGVAGHNLNDNSGTIKPQYSATGAWAGEEADFDTVQTPTDNYTIFRKVTSQTKRYWRFKINSTTVASLIGNLFLGVALELEREIQPPFSPPNFNRDRRIFNNMTQGGNYTGRVLRRKGNKVDIMQKLVTRAWMDANWHDLADHVELYPFYFMWSNDNYSGEVAYCIANDIDYPVTPQSSFMDFTLKCTALYDV